MKKLLFVALALFFAVSLASTVSAGVGNTSQQGSVVIYPKIDITPGKDTFVFLSNSSDDLVYIECIWVDAFQNPRDTTFFLTPNQPIVFNARTGKGFNPRDPLVTVSPFEPVDTYVGELKCWATNDDGVPISFNYLSGQVKVIDYTVGVSFEYNAYAFRALAAPEGTPTVAPVDGQVTLPLDDVAYDACPNYWLANFLAGGAILNTTPRLQIYDNDLTLVNCKEDLTQDRTPNITKAQFWVYNENEYGFSGAYQCVTCWFENFLSKIQKNPSTFTYNYLGTTVARMLVDGVASTQCAGSQDAPLIGLMVEYLKAGTRFIATASTGFVEGTETTGFIKYDLAP